MKVFKLIRNELPVKLLFIGDGPERPHIEDMARHCNNAADVRFLGKQEQMEDLLPMADLFLLPSQYESFGLAALEAMAAEVPVISTNAGGLPEIITNGENGYMSDIGDVDDMAKNAISIIGNEATHKKFRANALEVARGFDISKIVPVYEQLYKKVLKN